MAEHARPTVFPLIVGAVFVVAGVSAAIGGNDIDAGAVISGCLLAGGIAGLLGWWRRRASTPAWEPD